jgi:hypothetical protein
MNKESNQNLQKSLSEVDQNKLNYALAELFFGLSRSNWVQGCKLGTARQKALEQIESFLKSKDPNNPVVKYLYKTYMENRARWAKAIVTSQKSEKTMDCPRENMNKSAAWGAKWVKSAMGELNARIEEFGPKTATKEAASAPEKPQEAVVVEMRSEELLPEQKKEAIRRFIEKGMCR